MMNKTKMIKQKVFRNRYSNFIKALYVSVLCGVNTYVDAPAKQMFSADSASANGGNDSVGPQPALISNSLTEQLDGVSLSFLLDSIIKDLLELRELQGELALKDAEGKLIKSMEVLSDLAKVGALSAKARGLLSETLTQYHNKDNHKNKIEEINKLNEFILSIINKELEDVNAKLDTKQRELCISQNGTPDEQRELVSDKIDAFGRALSIKLIGVHGESPLYGIQRVEDEYREKIKSDFKSFMTDLESKKKALLS